MSRHNNRLFKCLWSVYMSVHSMSSENLLLADCGLAGPGLSFKTLSSCIGSGLLVCEGVVRRFSVSFCFRFLVVELGVSTTDEMVFGANPKR